MSKFPILLVLIFSIACTVKGEKSSPPSPTVDQPTSTVLFQGSDVIWGFDFIDSDHILFTERSGKLKILNLKTKGTVVVQNLPASQQYGQGGLLDVILHPEFSKNGWVYFSYAVKEANSYETRISRAQLKDDKLSNVQVLFTSNSGSTLDIHFGSRIVFDGEGHIFFTVGDRGQRDDAQKLTTANGKVHRLMDDGQIPTDNPFAKQKGAVPSIWSFGHRNLQGLYYDSTTKILWEQEHGPMGGDEINIIEKGKNYGWPVITYGREYSGPKIGTTHKDGMEQPAYYYTPSIAPSGLAIYKGNIYSGALALTHLNRLVMDGKKVLREERLLEPLHERVRNVRVGPDHSLYISTDSGKIMQLKI